MSDYLIVPRELLERLQERLDPHIDARDWGMVCDALKAPAVVEKSETNDQIAAVMMMHGTPLQQAEAIRYAAGLKAPAAAGDTDPGPDYPDGHDHEGFAGGCERMGCGPVCVTPAVAGDEREAFEAYLRRRSDVLGTIEAALQGWDEVHDRYPEPFNSFWVAWQAGAAWQRPQAAKAMLAAQPEKVAHSAQWPTTPGLSARTSDDEPEVQRLRKALQITRDTIDRQLEVIASRATGNYLDKLPVVRSLKAHRARCDAALAASTWQEVEP